MYVLICAIINVNFKMAYALNHGDAEVIIS